ncbi:MAG TPA: DUF5615 family PIN-like protein [Ktedonobacteraceae bacterium]|nr:DUF5615 family PIN-like protein [Ktedonobacteraceae bacterium]
MIILADENMARSIAERLRRDGHTVAHVANIAAGISDPEVLKMAKRYHALLITEDKDFGELVIRNDYQETGVILVRLPGLNPTERAEIIADVIREHGERLSSAFTVIAPRLVRIRPYS